MGHNRMKRGRGREGREEIVKDGVYEGMVDRDKRLRENSKEDKSTGKDTT